MTLLSQPKPNSIPTQKIIPVEDQNVRVHMRGGTQPTLPERSNSTASTHSMQAPVDTKKDRDNYERVAKQLEVNRYN